ncbi:nickel pincer cofactor biosynthesis protein LarB [uncultured Paraglaciecola sp.]|uniref:nickel pincer cofactor biosynthesis protein LarB n=1 Tax=uncultured Paraglaciecola sp. TaxID=1765024 RepID=UPI0030D92400|tara:strand:- start:66024 stop:66695 length:672 start_codon:yes stop_codon:yes gene_type:complete
MDNFVWDKDRKSRTGVAEAIFCVNKNLGDLCDIIHFNLKHNTAVLLTRLAPTLWKSLPAELSQHLDYDEVSQTAMLNVDQQTAKQTGVCIVSAGTSDLAVAKEAQRTLHFNGFEAPIYADLGVAGLWRLLDKIDDIRQHNIIIALAGMEGALFSVLAGLVSAPVIAVPTSVGYGVSAGGKVALDSALSSCSPGILTVNIDNGFGAANAAIKIMKQFAPVKIRS